MGIGKTVLCVILMIALHTCGSSSQTVATKRDEDRGNLHPGRVILYRPVASNHEDRTFLNGRGGERRRYTWDRDQTELPKRTSPFDPDNKQGSRSEQERPYNRDKERNGRPEENRPYHWDKEDNGPGRNRPYNRDKERSNHPGQNRPYRHEKESGNRPEHNRPYNRDKERDRPYNRDKDRANHPEPDPKDKDRDDSRPGFSRDRVSVFRPQRYDDARKLPASKYTNDYFQPPRPTPQKQIQNRNSFLFPGEHESGRGSFWPHRGTHSPYHNVADYLPRERHRFQNSLGYNGESVGFKHRPRPALLQGNIATGIPIPIPGSGIIVASGPGGVRHVIHDLRVPVHTHVHHNGEKTQHVGNDGDSPYRIVGNQFSSGDNNPYGNINQAYKGVPIFIQTGTFAAKEYDPRFVALYRQVLEENQKKIVSISKEKVVQASFQSSPTYEWFSEPDPLYHPRNSALLTLPQLQLTTGPAFDTPTYHTEEPSTTGAGAHFLAQLHSTTGAFEVQLLPTEEPSESPREQLAPPPDPPDTSASPGAEPPNPTTTTPAPERPLASDDVYRLSSPFVPSEAVTTNPPPSATQPPAPDPIDEVISTSVSHSVSAIRLTRERIRSNATELLQTSHLTQTTQREPTENNASTTQQTTQQEPAENASTMQQTTQQEPAENASTMQQTTQREPAENNGSTTQQTTQREPAENNGSITQQTTQREPAENNGSITQQTTQREPAENNVSTTRQTTGVPEDSTTGATESDNETIETSTRLDNEIRPKADDVEATTLDDGRETTTTQTELDEGRTESDEGRTEPTTTATDLALTTLNYLVLSLVNQVRANTIAGENATTPLPSGEQT